MSGHGEAVPTVTVVAGRPTDDEIAALTVVLCAVLRRAAADLRPAAPARWTQAHRHVAPLAWTAAEGRHLG